MAVTVSVTPPDVWDTNKNKDQLQTIIHNLLNTNRNRTIVIEWDGGAQRGAIAAK